MADFKFKSRKRVLTLQVEKEGEETKVLEFSCNVLNYSVAKKFSSIGNDLLKASKGEVSEEMLDQIVAKEKETFESIAPGKWDEYFDFLEQDLAYMSELLELMMRTARDKAVSQERAEIVPEENAGEEV